MTRALVAALAVAVAALPPARAAAADQAPPSEAAPLQVTPLGYVETDWSWNFNEPSNGITNYRGFDNRHDTFTLANVALGASFEAWKQVTGKLVLQVGHTPDTYYAAEPAFPGASGAAGSDANVWKYVQEAHVGWRAPVGRGLLAEAGLFLSPIGPESIAAKDDWNWSRSDLFFGLPFYHTGLRVSYPVTDALTATIAVYNGWNSVVDDNDEKSVSASADYHAGILTAQLLYFGGVERPTGAPEGPYWRHDLDAYAQVDATSRVSFLAHANAGFEPNRFGTSGWMAGALYARVKVTGWMYFAARGDVFSEGVPSNAGGAASPIFWPVDWVSSGTLTVDFRPTKDNLSLRAEYRHDHADGAMFFRGPVAGDGVTTPYVPDARSQDTLTFGATAWF